MEILGNGKIREGLHIIDDMIEYDVSLLDILQ